ncbi:MAG: RNA polymerase sigma factor [Planctomycetota bacterium]|jgi:RNA polymerase sigma-70 factor (ECF subfamily)
MFRKNRDPGFERLVREWQQPVYGLALRMLGDPAEAEDATQEVFVGLLRNLDRYDPDREFRPWIYRVASNLVLNRIRARNTRRDKERAAARERTEASEDVPMEQAEREHAVRDELQYLEEEDRAMVVLHFYEGLSKSEAADVLGIPRTTLHARLDRALGRLKSGLQAAGHAAIVPVVPNLMREAPPPTVPPALRDNLLKLAAKAGQAAAPLAGSAVLIGGAVMAKKTIIAATALALGSLGIGYLVGHESAPRASHARGDGREGYEVGSRDDWKAAYDAMKKTLGDVERERDKLRAHLKASGGAAKSAEATKTAAIPASGIEWAKFSKLLAENHDLIMRVTGKEDGMESATAAEQAHLMQVLSEFMRVSNRARTISPAPFFDKRILPELVGAIYTETLDLSPEESAEWIAVARAVRDAHTAGFDPAAALPLERHAVRARMIADLKTKLASRVPADKRKRFEEASANTKSMTAGTRTEISLDLADEGGNDAIAERVIFHWNHAYKLTDKQRVEFRELALSFVRDAGDRYRQQSMGTPGADEARYDESILELQIAIEKRLVDNLSVEQRKRLVRAMPFIIRFRSGKGEDSIIMNSGF